MIVVRKGNEEVQIKDFLVKLYIRNGYEVVTDEPKEEVKEEVVEQPVAPKRTVRRKTATAKK